MISGCIFEIIRIMSRGNLLILSLSIIFWCFRQVRLVSFFVSSLFVPDAERAIVLARRGIFLTPIVDVVFNLLIFFALSLNFSQVVSSINIKLPKAKSSEVVTEKQVVVSIERNNKVYINDQALYLDQIPNYLDKINKDNVVVVKADKEIDHGFVVQIMDLIKRSGFKKLGIAVTKQE